MPTAAANWLLSNWRSALERTISAPAACSCPQATIPTPSSFQAEMRTNSGLFWSTAMKFQIIRQQNSRGPHSPFRVVEQTTGREVGWINRFLDREYVRRVADSSLRTYAFNLLHFVRWWQHEHHTWELERKLLSHSTLLDYLHFQSSLEPRPAASTINDRVADADRAIRNEF